MVSFYYFDGEEFVFFRLTRGQLDFWIQSLPYCLQKFVVLNWCLVFAVSWTLFIPKIRLLLVLLTILVLPVRLVFFFVILIILNISCCMIGIYPAITVSFGLVHFRNRLLTRLFVSVGCRLIQILKAHLLFMPLSLISTYHFYFTLFKWFELLL